MKVKIQANSESIAKGDLTASTNPFVIIKRSIKEEGGLMRGLKGYYKGIGSALLRQVTYGTAKFGLYLYFTDLIRSMKGSNI